MGPFDYFGAINLATGEKLGLCDQLALPVLSEQPLPPRLDVEGNGFWIQRQEDWIFLWPLDPRLRAMEQSLDKISHDLKNPLASILGYGELILEEGQGEVQAYSQILLSKGKRLETMVQYLVDYSRILQGRELPWSPREISLESLKKALEKKKIFILWKVPENSPLFLDKRILLSWFFEILANSQAYNGSVHEEIVFQALGEDYEIRFTHSGYLKLNLEALPEPFSAQGSEKSLCGLGLGLIRIRAYTRSLGGRLLTQGNDLILRWKITNS